MSNIDVFNGDADGLCALHQLRLAEPCDAELVTGVKRDNALVSRVHAAAGDSVTVLDISLSHNLAAVQALLNQGVSITYFDHHDAPGDLHHPLLRLTIDASPQVCTSILVDRYLGGRHRNWAVVGAFGDNMPEAALKLGSHLTLKAGELYLLKRLGECINYNSYGDTENDLMYPPAELYRLIRPFADPLRFMENENVYERLEKQRTDDMNKTLALTPTSFSDAASVFQLPDAAWSRRIVGNFANWLCAANPTRAYAVLVPNARGTLTASLRVPTAASITAAGFARRYGGNGRHCSAGIDDLRPVDASRFSDDFMKTFPGA